MRRISLCAAALAVALSLTSAYAWQDAPKQDTAKQAGAAAPATVAPPAAATVTHFHHLHLNATDPAADIAFYTTKFDAEKGRFAGLLDAVWAQKSWMLFSKVSAPPAAEVTSSIWHFGWGAEDMQATYQKQLDAGTKFSTPITPLGPGFFFAYVQGPDNAIIELNTAQHHRFGHIHMLSLDPIKAGEWYAKWFNATGRLQRDVRMIREFPVSPSASLNIDNVNLIIFPVTYARVQWPELWKDRQDFESPKGHVVDHLGFSVDNLPEFLEKMRKDGVKVTDEIKTSPGGKIKYAFIEGPDHCRIELVEGHATKE
jgi:predicted enzyme related to lactoylglutathione lyase